MPMPIGAESSCDNGSELRVVISLEVAMFIIGLLLWLIGYIMEKYNPYDDVMLAYLGRCMSFLAVIVIIFTAVFVAIYRII